MANTTDAIIAREQSIEKYRILREPYYLSIRDEVMLFETAYKAKLPVMLKGPTGCGKTRFVEARPGRTLSARRRRYRVARRAAHHGRPPRRDLLSGRGRRGAQGHHRSHTPAHGRPAHSTGREAWNSAKRPRRFYAGHFLQSRLSERAERPEAIDAPAVPFARIRLSAGRGRGADRRPRGRSQRADGARSGQDRREGAQPERARTGRGSLDAPAGLRRPDDRARRRSGDRLRSVHRQPDHR